MYGLIDTLSNNLANAGARGMQFLYSDIPNAAKRMIGSILPGQQAAPQQGYGMTPAQQRTEDLKAIAPYYPPGSAEAARQQMLKNQQMNDVLNQIK